jgi:hypothetical protein
MKLTKLAFTVALVFAKSVHAQSCHSSDTYSSHIVTVINSLMAPADSNFRRDELHLPFATTAQISLVTDEAICTRARQALDSLIFATNPEATSPRPIRTLYVFSIASHFGVIDSTDLSGVEWVPLYFFGPTWSFLSVHLPY